MEPRRTPLQQIDVPHPCLAPWDAMSGDRQVRFCPHCRKNVYNLSAMPRDEAERLVCETAGSLCVRFDRDANGRVMTLDYDRAAGRRRGWRYWTGLGVVAAVGVAVTNALLAGCLRPAVGPRCVQGAMPPLSALPTTRPTTTPFVPPAAGSIPPADSSAGPNESKPQ